MSNYFNDFFNGWNEHDVYFARNNNPVLHDAQETLWRRVYDKVAMLVSRTNLGLSIESFDVRRIAMQPGRNQNGPRALRKEPFLYAYSDENDFFVIKFVFSPQNGIQIGIDYRGIREQNNNAPERFHQYLQHPLPDDGFILKGSQQYRNANEAIEALQARGRNRESKIEPCFIIGIHNSDYNDDRYIQDMEIALRKSSNFRKQLIEQDTNHNINKEQKNGHQNKFSFYRNCIWAGAPGTGKSHDLNRQAQSMFAGNIMRVTFHPEYTYYDFVGTYRPKMSKIEKGKIEYDFVPGPFAKMLKKALWNPGQEYCLIIEEINRANMAAVFGDVFQLLDRASEDRENDKVEKHQSEYAICPSEELHEYLLKKEDDIDGTQPNTNIKNELRLPANLYIWATMNSADQGVFPMDTAFKRRWSFVNMAINPSEGQDPDYNPESAWDKIRSGINDMLLKHHVQEDKLMGYYFLKKEERDSKENLEKALKEKVLLYLFEDAAKPFRGKIFQNEYNTCENLRGKLVVDDPNLGVFLEKVWDGIPQQSKPEDTKPATEDVDNADNP